MPVYSDEEGTYSTRPDGTKDYACTTCLEINGRKAYDFNQETGVLQISMSPSSLELLKKVIGEIPKEGRDLVLPNPFPIVADGPARFKGVRSIESIPGLKEDEFMLKMKEVSPRTRTVF